MIPAGLLAAILNLWLWPLPEFDYWQHWFAESQRSKVLPHIPGV